MRNIAILSATLGLAALASAQALPNTYGFIDGFEISYGTRIGIAATGEGYGLMQIDNADYQAFGYDAATMSNTFIIMQVTVQDFLCDTPEEFDVGVFMDDGVAPGGPDIAVVEAAPAGARTMLPTTAPGPCPFGPGTGVAWRYTFTFTGDVPVGTVDPTPGSAGGPDAFFGVWMGPSPAFPADGTSTVGLWGDDQSTAPTEFDLPGRRGDPLGPVGGTISDDTYNYAVATSLSADPVNPPVIGATTPHAAFAQMNVELGVTGVGGVSTAIIGSSVSVTYPAGVAAPGSTSFFSGIHPDVSTPAQNVGRSDQLGFQVRDVNNALGGAYVLVGFGGSPVGINPLTALGAPGASTGAICSNFQTGTGLFLFLDANGEVFTSFGVPAGTVIATGAGIDLTWQGFSIRGLLPGTGPVTIHSSGCATQKL